MVCTAYIYTLLKSHACVNLIKDTNVVYNTFRITNVTGKIKINQSPRTMKTFSRMSAYIMQNDLVQPLLTVEESMMVAANLKLSKDVTHKEKKRVV